MSQDVFRLTSPDGRESELPVHKGSTGPDVLDISKLYREQGVFTYDPGFMATGSCSSDITYIDGDKGVLAYRGYPVEQRNHATTQRESMLLGAMHRSDRCQALPVSGESAEDVLFMPVRMNDVGFDGLQGLRDSRIQLAQVPGAFVQYRYVDTPIQQAVGQDARIEDDRTNIDRRIRRQGARQGEHLCLGARPQVTRCNLHDR